MSSVIDDKLTLPIGGLASQIDPLQPEDSLRVAAREMFDHGLPLVPVANGLELLGIVDGSVLSRAMAAGTGPDSAVAQFAVPAVVLPTWATGAEALRTFETTGASALVVVDANGLVAGILTPAHLYGHRGDRHMYGKIGGMATPFGVYLTNGAVSGGVGPLALVATGVLMFSCFLLAATLAQGGASFLPSTVTSRPWFDGALQAFTLVLFLLGIRSLPLAGVHAAEHMVVHAIERGEDLKPEIVSRMPRVHPRCGTNLAIGATVFLGILSAPWIPNQEFRLLTALVVTIAVWRPLGAFVQYWFTTRPPTRTQVELGIRAGTQILARIESSPVLVPGVGVRLMRSGLFQIMLGATLAQFVVWAVYESFRVPMAWRVF